MRNVSSGFKDAIKASNRNMYGYVELNYEHSDYNLYVSTTPPLADIVYSDGSGLIANKKTLPRYATLENNYTLLDGSFMVWNENRKITSGIITDDVFEDINDTKIIVDNDVRTGPSKGVTIYFKDNLPINFTVVFYFYDDTPTMTETITNNTSMTYQKIFDDEARISYIRLVVTQVEHPDNRLRIACVDFNISDLYQGDELINFDVNEEIDLLLESVPINTCTLNINNYPDAYGNKKFDPINPNGLTKYLTKNSTVEPYVGILTENNGVEYVKLGTFYVSDWSSNDDGNVTINSKSLMDKLKSQRLFSDGTFCYNSGYYWDAYSLGTYLTQKNGYNIYTDIPNNIINNEILKHTEILDYLRMCTICSQDLLKNRILQVNRDNEVHIMGLNTNVVDSLPRTFLMKDANYTVNEPIRYLKFTAMKDAHNLSTGTKDVLNLTYALTSDEEYVWIDIDGNLINYSPSFTKTFTYTTTGSGTATLVDVNDRLAYIHFKGVENEAFTLHLTTNIWAIDGDITTTIKNNDVGETLSINVQEYFRINDSNKRNRICNGLLRLKKKYHIGLETMGDPSLELGDTVAVQTRYDSVNDGYKNMIITKQHFTFDGGLTCSIEGEGN